MNYLKTILIGTVFMTNTIIFDFNKNSNIDAWRIVDDVVMGGQSFGQFFLNDEGNGVFKGAISLENNGGFSSVRYPFDEVDIKSNTKFVLTVKGDKKEYQFRVKSKMVDNFSYTQTFKTNGEWQIIEIPFFEMHPVFRGRKLQMANYSAKCMQEIAFLIGNKENETFELVIKSIVLSQ